MSPLIVWSKKINSANSSFLVISALKGQVREFLRDADDTEYSNPGDSWSVFEFHLYGQPQWIQTDLFFHILITLMPLGLAWISIKRSGVSTCNFIQRHRRMESLVLRHKYVKYLHRTNTGVFNTIPAITGTKFYLFSTIIGRISLFQHAIYSSTGLHCWQCTPVEE